MKIETLVLYILLGISIFIIGVLVKNDGKLYTNINKQNNIDLSTGGEYFRLVYIGSANCQYSNNEQLKKNINKLINKFRETLSQTKYKFITTGISVDNNSSIGLKYLNSISQFDEIIVGTSTLNLGSVYYSAGLPSTPQIYLILESHKSDLSGINIQNLESRQDLINSITGLYNINEFYSKVSEANISHIINLIGLE